MPAHLFELNKSIFFQHIYRTYPMNMPSPHWHNHYEIYYLLKGSRKYFIEDRIYTIQAGDVVLIPKNISHKTTVILTDEHERIVMNIAEAYIPSEFRKFFMKFIIRLPETMRKDFEKILARINQEYTKQDEFSEKMCVNYIYELLAFLVRLSRNYPDFINDEKQDIRIEEAIAYLAENFALDITLKSVADHLSLNREYFSKKFKKETGFGFSEYLNQIRISHAIRLISTTDLTVTEIARQCGFNDSNYFSSVFKKIKGLNPLAYKKQENLNLSQ